MAETIEFIESVKFKNRVGDGMNLSAMGLIGEFLIVAGDEDSRLQVLRRHEENFELLAGREIYINNTNTEADIEGIACEVDSPWHTHRHPEPNFRVSSQAKEPRRPGRWPRRFGSLR